MQRESIRPNGDSLRDIQNYNLYSPKFKKFLPRLINVPHFIGILMHSGIDEKNSAGCIIVGKNTIKGRLTDSKNIMAALMEAERRKRHHH